MRILTIAILCFSQMAFGQINQFQLKDAQELNFNFKVIEFTPILSQYFLSQNQGVGNNTKTESKGLNSILFLNYQHEIRNNKFDIAHENNSNINLDLDYFKNGPQQDDADLSIIIDHATTVNYYPYSNNLFYSIGSNLRIQSNHDLFDSNHNFNLFNDTEFSIGYGRPNVVTYAWTGLEVIAHLEKNNILLKIPSFEKFQEFYFLINKLKRQRNRDFRDQKIKELDQVLSFLVDNKFVESTPLSFAYFNDAYEYEALFLRQHGSIHTFGLVPRFQINNQGIDNSAFNIRIKSEYFNAINRYWQFDYNLECELGKNIFYFDQLFGTVLTEDWSINTDLTLAISYYFNGRTFFRVMNNVFFNTVFKQEEYTILPINLTFDYQHFVSKKISINAQFLLNHSQIKNSTFPLIKKGWNQAFYFGFNYRLF